MLKAKKKAVKKAVKRAVKRVVKKIVKKSPKTKFYMFHQNNSGGQHVYDVERGISVNVIVEAYSTSDANDRAEDIGLYFGGDADCDCCGDRWYKVYTDDKGDLVPSEYGRPVFPGQNWTNKNGFGIKWEEDNNFEGFIHYLNKPFKGYGKI